MISALFKLHRLTLDNCLLVVFCTLLYWIYTDMAEVLSKKDCGSQSLYYIHFEDCKSVFCWWWLIFTPSPGPTVTLNLTLTRTPTLTLAQSYPNANLIPNSNPIPNCNLTWLSWNSMNGAFAINCASSNQLHHIDCHLTVGLWVTVNRNLTVGPWDTPYF